MRRKKDIEKLAERRVQVAPPDEDARDRWNGYVRDLVELVKENIVDTYGVKVEIEWGEYEREWYLTAERFEHYFPGEPEALKHVTFTVRERAKLPAAAGFDQVFAGAQRLVNNVNKHGLAMRAGLAASFFVKEAS